MTLLAAVTSLLVVVVLCWLVGFVTTFRFGARHDVGFSMLLGMFLLHAVMQWASHLGVAWSRSSLLLGLILTVGLVLLSSRRPEGQVDRREEFLWRPESRSSWSLGDGICLVIIGLFGYLSVTLEAVHSDYVFHWGAKAERFFLARGVDWSYLSWPETGIFHPDYPHLLPDLYAAVALLTGEFNERSQQLWGTVFLMILWLVCRKRLGGRKAIPGDLALISIVATTAAFGVAYYQSGGADLPFATLVVVAAAELLALASGERGGGIQVLRLGVVAGLLASCKIEGVVMAAFLLILAVWALRRHLRSLQNASIVGLGLLLPVLIATVPWFLGVVRHDLLQESNLGALEMANLGPVLETMYDVLWLDEWQGLCLVILLLPGLVFWRRSRPVGVLLALQLAFYFYVYLTTPHEPVYFVLSNFPRLLYHLVPALLLAFFVSLPGMVRPTSDLEERV